MNTNPLEVDMAISNVEALKKALKDCDGTLGPLRTALAECKSDLRNTGFNSFESDLLIALGYIVESPTPFSRRIGNSFRSNLTHWKDYDAQTVVEYGEYAVRAMKAVQPRLNMRSCFDRALHKLYEDAINEEMERIEGLVQLIAV